MTYNHWRSGRRTQQVFHQESDSALLSSDQCCFGGVFPSCHERSLRRHQSCFPINLSRLEVVELIPNTNSVV